MTVNLGPVAPTLSTSVAQTGNGLTYNPRCMKRDINSWVSSRWSTDAQSFSLLTQNPDIYWFQTVMQGLFAEGFYGVHTAGHFTFQGDPAGDLFTSPGDPMFWLHHAQIDRTWWMWQNMDIEGRTEMVSGTETLGNVPPSRNGTLADVVGVGNLADAVVIGDVVSTVGGPLCYVYVYIEGRG